MNGKLERKWSEVSPFIHQLLQPDQWRGCFEGMQSAKDQVRLKMLELGPEDSSRQYLFHLQTSRFPNSGGNLRALSHIIQTASSSV